MARKNSQFQRGTAVYTCNTCERKTRETGYSESFCGLCVDCYALAGIDNSITDGASPSDYALEVSFHMGSLKRHEVTMPTCWLDLAAKCEVNL